MIAKSKSMRLVPHLAIVFLFVCVSFNRAAAPRLSLTHNGEAVAVRLAGDPGVEYVLEAASESARNWNLVSSFVADVEPYTWEQPGANSGARFFRARSADPFEDRFARNFRLIDQ